MNTYEERKQAKIERYNANAEKAEKKSIQLHNQAEQWASLIPFGQPILIGHYSEGRDRRFRDKIHNKFKAGFNAADKAQYWRDKAEAAESSTAISSDDPEAPEKLAEKITQAEARQQRMKAANSAIRKGKTDEAKRAGLAALGYKESRITELLTPDFAGRIGFPAYALTNNNANIHRMKERLTKLERARTRTNQEREHDLSQGGAVKIIENVEMNRIQLVFPGKPSEEVRRNLKAHGFRWAPSAGAWQRHLNNAGKAAVDSVLCSL